MHALIVAVLVSIYQKVFYTHYCQCRYGSLFKTHFLGSPTVVSMDPELNRYILMNESKGLVPGYPRSMVDLLGKLNVAAVQGLDHKRIRGSLLSMVNPAAVRQQLLHKIDNFIRVHLAGWDGKVVDIQEKTKLVMLQNLHSICILLRCLILMKMFTAKVDRNQVNSFF